jgi:hypothetical protein
VFRLVFGSAMAISLVVGFVAILRKDIVRHRAWMMRGYALGVGTGTQVLTNMPADIILGRMPEGTLRALLLGAGWVINRAVVEWLLRRRPTRRRAAVSAGAAAPRGRTLPAGAAGASRTSRRWD